MQGKMEFIWGLLLPFKFFVMIKLFFLSVLTIMAALKAAPQKNPDEIIGRWMSSENNLAVEIFKTNNEYKAKVIWIDDSDDKNRPMNTRNDWKNPNENLRTRKIIGLVVMHGLVYNAANHDWRVGGYMTLTAAKTGMREHG